LQSFVAESKKRKKQEKEEKRPRASTLLVTSTCHQLGLSGFHASFYCGLDKDGCDAPMSPRHLERGRLKVRGGFVLKSRDEEPGVETDNKTSRRQDAMRCDASRSQHGESVWPLAFSGIDWMRCIHGRDI
jgi:hypothetical protein